jgi:hypothetical protein
MEIGKRMVLVDEQWLEDVYRKQDSNWKRPTGQKVKSKLNRQMKKNLEENNVPDDGKVKLHNQSLARFLHTRRKIPEDTAVTATAVASAPTDTNSQAGKVHKHKKKDHPFQLFQSRVLKPKRLRSTQKRFSLDEFQSNLLQS